MKISTVLTQQPQQLKKTRSLNVLNLFTITLKTPPQQLKWNKKTLKLLFELNSHHNQIASSTRFSFCVTFFLSLVFSFLFDRIRSNEPMSGMAWPKWLIQFWGQSNRIAATPKITVPFKLEPACLFNSLQTHQTTLFYPFGVVLDTGSMQIAPSSASWAWASSSYLSKLLNPLT